MTYHLYGYRAQKTTVEAQDALDAARLALFPVAYVRDEQGHLVPHTRQIEEIAA